MQSFIGSYQTITHHLTHIFLEETAFNSIFFTTDAETIFRASGLMGHPTFYGTFLAMLLPISFGLLLFTRRNKLSKIIFFSVFLTSFLSVYGTISRSAWITSIFVGIIFFFFWYKDHKALKHAFTSLNFKLIIILSTCLGIWFFGSIIIGRIQSLSTFFTLGNGQARLSLINYSIKMITDSPLIGIGPNHFTSAMVKYGLDEFTSSFIFPVHNVLLLIASETGLISAIALVLFIAFALKLSYSSARRYPFLAGLWLGCIAYILSSQVHPLIGQDPTFDYFFLMLGIISTKI